MDKTEQALKGGTTSTEATQAATARVVQTTESQSKKETSNVVDLSDRPVGSVVTLKHGDKTLQVKIKKETFIPDFAKLFSDVVIDHARELSVLAESVIHNVRGADYSLRAAVARIRDSLFKDENKDKQ